MSIAFYHPPCVYISPAAEIIHLLNTGTVKQLKSLQSVGEKRAQLIHSWRQMFGEFTKVSQKTTKSFRPYTFKFVILFLDFLGFARCGKQEVTITSKPAVGTTRVC